MRLLSFLVALGASSAAAQAPEHAPQGAPEPPPLAPTLQAQQAPPVAPSPANVTPAAPALIAPEPPPPPVYVQPRQQAPLPYSPPQPVLIQPARRPPPPLPYRLPAAPLPPLRVEPSRPRVYGDAGAPFALGVGGALLWRDEDQRRFGGDKVRGAFELLASYDVWAPGRVFVLAAGLNYRHDQRPRSDLADLTDNQLTADLTGRFRVAPWFWPHLRAGVGFATTRVSVRDPYADLKFDDRNSGAAGSFGAGLTLRTPTRAFETERGHLSSLSLGLMVEGGYTLAADAELSPEPTRGSEVRRASPASFSAPRSAAFLRILGVIRF